MIDNLIKISAILFGVGMFPWIILNTYTSFKLRKKRISYIEEISNSAPVKFRDRARFLMESNISWIFASSAGHLWFSYLMLKYAWKIPSLEIDDWHKKIKEIYSDDYILYKYLNLLINLWISSFIFLIFLIFIR